MGKAGIVSGNKWKEPGGGIVSVNKWEEPGY